MYTALDSVKYLISNKICQKSLFHASLTNYSSGQVEMSSGQVKICGTRPV